MGTKDQLIARLQEEVLFIQETTLNDDYFENYDYNLKGDLSEFRTFRR